MCGASLINSHLDGLAYLKSEMGHYGWFPFVKKKIVSLVLKPHDTKPRFNT